MKPLKQPAPAGAPAQAVAVASAPVENIENPEAALTRQAIQEPGPEEIASRAPPPAPEVPVPKEENAENSSVANEEEANKEQANVNSLGSDSEVVPDHLKWPEIQPKRFFPFAHLIFCWISKCRQALNCSSAWPSQQYR